MGWKRKKWEIITWAQRVNVKEKAVLVILPYSKLPWRKDYVCHRNEDGETLQAHTSGTSWDTGQCFEENSAYL